MEWKSFYTTFLFSAAAFLPAYSWTHSPLETPVIDTPQMLLYSIQGDLRRPEYRETILPNNFSYLHQLLGHGKQFKQPRIYAESTLSLFSKLIKGSPYVNAYVFSDFLGHVPTLMQQYFAPTQFEMGSRKLLTDIDMLDRFQETVNGLLYHQLKTNWDQLTTAPLQFLDRVTKHITDVAQDEVAIIQLRHSLIKFIEVSLAKLVWSPESSTEAWRLFKTMSDQLANLLETNVLDDINELDDLYWSLVHRFCYFVNIMSENLPITFYESIYKELDAQDPENSLAIFKLDEQESFMETKKECLQRTLLAGRACRQKHELEGLIPNARSVSS